jgi:nicotinate-nucleotide pyrophosphorylase (carboxylating)
VIEYNQIKKLPDNYIKSKISEFLLEDIPDADRTSEGVFTIHDFSTAIIQAEEDIIFAGEQLFQFFFDDTFNIKMNFSDGQKVAKGEIIAIISGRTDIILSRERTLLNLLQRLCGIASLTNKFAEIARPYNVKVLDTRKTTPGLRLFEKFAVVVGGGYNHRMDLSSGILIKDNHIKAAGGIKKVLGKVKASNEKNLKIELEVDNFEQVKEALEVGVDGFLLDNMKPELIKEIVDFIRKSHHGKSIFIEASGGISLSNLSDYVSTGIDAISSGSLTHSVKASEIHMEFI